MITVGIDVGTETTKVVVLNGTGTPSQEIIPRSTEPPLRVAERVLKQALEKAGISAADIQYIVATGVGRKYISFANQESPDFQCLARGIDWVMPQTRTVLDLGAQKSIAVRCNGGRVTKFATSNKCATGSGKYLEIVSNILGISNDAMAALYLKSEEHLEIQATCAVFAESEIVSLIHQKKKPEDILKGALRGLAEHIYSQLLEVGIEEDLAIVGGVAKNPAMVTAIQEVVGYKANVPDNPEMVCAFGAALIAQDRKCITS